MFSASREGACTRAGLVLHGTSPGASASRKGACTLRRTARLARPARASRKGVCDLRRTSD